MFKDNKYTKWYFKLIEYRKINVVNLEEYFETHHIIPKCLGGSDDIENLVKLTAREHFISHLLLTKMHDEPKLKFGLHMMTMINPKQKKWKRENFIYYLSIYKKD